MMTRRGKEEGGEGVARMEKIILAVVSNEAASSLYYVKRKKIPQSL